MENLQEQFGNIDIYLFDQLLKGAYADCRSVVDIGCGGGRNSYYFLKNGYEVFAIDQDPEAIVAMRRLAAGLAPQLPEENFVLGDLLDMPFEDERFDLVICVAVLHFARDVDHFEQMLHAIWRVLKPGGFLLARLASDIGTEQLVEPLGQGRYLLPDGTERFLVNQDMLIHYTEALGGALHEPLKTTNVQNLRSMTTWCVRKGQRSPK